MVFDEYAVCNIYNVFNVSFIPWETKERFYLKVEYEPRSILNRFSNIIFAITPNINVHIDSLILPVDQTFTIQRNRVQIRSFKMHSIDRRISIVEN